MLTGECSTADQSFTKLPNLLVVQTGLLSSWDVRPEPPAPVDVCHNVLKQSLPGHICVLDRG